MYHKGIKQMSDSTLVMMLITISGGLQDAYTYWLRDGVFANAQTGNIVLMMSNITQGNYRLAFRYLIPLSSFCIGVILAEQIHGHLEEWNKLHWRQIVLLIEIVFLFLSGLLPSNLHFLANALISCACAMQVETFRKVNGCGYASTMCIGNLRGAMSSLSKWMRTKDKEMSQMCIQYLTIIFFFAIGAGLGKLLSVAIGFKAIWASGLLLALATILMMETCHR